MGTVIKFRSLNAEDRLIIWTELRNVIQLRIKDVLLGDDPQLDVVIVDISVKEGHHFRMDQPGTLRVCKPSMKIPLGKVASYIEGNDAIGELGKGYYGLLSQPRVRPSGLRIVSCAREK